MLLFLLQKFVGPGVGKHRCRPLSPSTEPEVHVSRSCDKQIPLAIVCSFSLPQSRLGSAVVSMGQSVFRRERKAWPYRNRNACATSVRTDGCTDGRAYRETNERLK